MSNIVEFVTSQTDLDPNDLRVMHHYRDIGRDIGSAAYCFGATDLSRIEVGEARGGDEKRGAYEWWPLTVDGQTIGELRVDAAGLTVHVTPRTWMHGIGLLVNAVDD